MANQERAQEPPILNQYVQGLPSREDYRLVEDMRRNFIPAVAALERLRMATHFANSKGEAVNPVLVQQTTSIVTRQMAQNMLLNHGGYRHEAPVDKETRMLPKKDAEGNTIRNGDGTPVLEAKEVTVTRYRDAPIPGNAEKMKALHVFPAPPFPMNQDFAAGMASTLLRKRLEPMEEAWVDARLKKAAEFVHIPAEWDIQPKKVLKEEAEGEADSDDEDDGFIEGLPTKRVASTLPEEDILDIWRVAHQEAFDRSYLKQHYPDEFGDGQDDGEEGDEDDEGEDDEEDEDEFEDAMDVDSTDASDAKKALDSSATATSAPAAIAKATAPKAEVHKAIPGMHQLSLGFVHKFMATGEVPK